MLWHRLRGHKIRRYWTSVDTTIRGYGIRMEQGGVDHGRECSCGRRWPA